MASAGERLALAADAVWGRYGPPPGTDTLEMSQLRTAAPELLSVTTKWLQAAQFLRVLVETSEKIGSEWPLSCFDAAWDESGASGGQPEDYFVFLFGVFSLNSMAFFTGPPTNASAVRARINLARGYVDGAINEFPTDSDFIVETLSFLGFRPYQNAIYGHAFTGTAGQLAQAQVIPV